MTDIITETNRVFLAPADYVDSDHPRVEQAATHLTAGAVDAASIARHLYVAVREIPYGAPDFDRLESFKASTVLAEGRGYCVAKASTFAALCRAAGVPARLGFADVSNHLATARVLDLMGGELFAWHGYAEVLLDGRWVKVSPTFDSALCARMGVPPLAFDGSNDAHLQPFDRLGRTFMRYEKTHGTFHDVPARFLATEMRRLYPRAHAAISAGEFRSPAP
ncbi:transglutaminase family protein [Reyranella sp. CPCC 100927]|uniref:transglutaminase-like domain-containing protein n=1 Tax=Reyranella sp. CPCC 100927 TaxID=2599616 RepID=UPI0011B7DFF6|nr:transglutaminase family protein [Reyranella sp. CPCC 100927]TWT01703.1 transglutaminase family protein [Reyranella sp. CPCC 100927]